MKQPCRTNRKLNAYNTFIKNETVDTLIRDVSGRLFVVEVNIDVIIATNMIPGKFNPGEKLSMAPDTMEMEMPRKL